MMKLIKNLDFDTYSPLDFIVADTDSMSIDKIAQFDTDTRNLSTYTITKINRSRRVGQSYLTSIFTTLLAILNAIPILFKSKPRVLLLNGPGTCVPIAFIQFILSRLLFVIPRARIVFVESVCRVKSLSLTGKIFYYFRLTDDFIVQWSELKEKYPRTTYLGRLV